MEKPGDLGKDGENDEWDFRMRSAVASLDRDSAIPEETDAGPSLDKKDC
jgi:hypothetical protein